MYKTIIVPMALDHGLSPQSLQIARALLAPGGSITALHVYEAPEGTVSAYVDEETMREAYQKATDRLNEKVHGIEGVTPVITKGHSARTIIDFANSGKAECIVMGSHKPGIRDYFLGSTASHVVRHAQCAVHVHRGS
ncbi:universal stress protein [uncultured Roseobacter sp.]|uniref:universal stress protein n=1 Tax=uncultured Roseobacter sp. TaxID=114847 RepID=UPI00261DEE92|nr:universal stress protein [uncultured Roseobacter sp.]